MRAVFGLFDHFFVIFLGLGGVGGKYKFANLNSLNETRVTERRMCTSPDPFVRRMNSTAFREALSRICKYRRG